MAEFKEVMKQRKRMCKASECTSISCELKNMARIKGDITCDYLLTEYYEEAEEIIMKWAEENPIMTNADMLKKVFGFDVNRDDCLFGESEECKTHSACATCPLKNWWNQEYKEPKEV